MAKEASGKSLFWPSGVDAKVHVVVPRRSMVVWLVSKSSKYVVASPLILIPRGEPGMSWANSAWTWTREGALVEIKGKPSKKRVRPGKFFWYCVWRPQIRLEMGSSPALTFCVSGRSDKRSNEPPTVQSLEI